MQVGKVSMHPETKQVNEDCTFYDSKHLNETDRVHICMIADGMGGHESGDAASYFAIRYIQKWFKSTVWHHHDVNDFLKDCRTSLIDAFYELNNYLIDIARLENEEIGTTLSVIIFAGNQYFLCHVGDTRIYRYRHKILTHKNPTDETIDLSEVQSLTLLTEDHTWLNDQRKNGYIKDSEEKKHSKAHLLTQCLGIKGGIRPYTSAGTFTVEDYFLLCSDGFHDLITDEELHREWDNLFRANMNDVQGICDHFYHFVSTSNPLHDDVSLIVAKVADEMEL